MWCSIHCPLQKMVGWVALEVSFYSMFKFKQFNNCFHLQNVTVNLSLLNCYSNSFFDLCRWVISYRSWKQTSSLYLALNKASDLVLSNDQVILKEKIVAKNILCIYGRKKIETETLESKFKFLTCSLFCRLPVGRSCIKHLLNSVLYYQFPNSRDQNVL